MTKVETRAVAARLGLAVAEKADSQDICFVPTGRYADVIERLRPGAAEAGEIVHLDGRILGRHDGIINYTVGQRRGLGIASGEPLYVVRLDADRAQVVVGPKEALFTRKIVLRDVNWLGNGALEATDDLEIAVKVRSTRPPAPARLSWEDGAAVVTLAHGDHGISPGQACVFYDGADADARVLGGGWIARTDEGAASRAATARQAEPAAAI